MLLLVLPIAHNLPLACPGIQGFLFNGGTVVLSARHPAGRMFADDRQRTASRHIKVVPALLIRLHQRSGHDRARSLVGANTIQSGGQRLQPEVRLLARQG